MWCANPYMWCGGAECAGTAEKTFCAGAGALVRRRRTFARTKYAFCMVFAPHGGPPPGPPVRPPPTVPTPRPRSPKTGRRELATPSFPRNHTTYWLPLPKMASRALEKFVLCFRLRKRSALPFVSPPAGLNSIHLAHRTLRSPRSAPQHHAKHPAEGTRILRELPCSPNTAPPS